MAVVKNRIKKDVTYTYEMAMDQALRFLGPRFLSAFELRQKMKQKGIPTELIEEVEERLIDLDYINDERLSREALAFLMDCEKYSTFMIRKKLRDRGLAIGKALATYDEVQVGFSLLEQKHHFSTMDVEEEDWAPVERKKIIYFLNNRGFSPSTISQICGELEAYLI